MQRVTAALSSRVWLTQFKFVYWISSKVRSVSSWGGSCICHSELLASGASVDCKRKGRLLSVCYEFGWNRLQDMLAETSCWAADQWDHDLDFFATTKRVCTGCFCPWVRPSCFFFQQDSVAIFNDWGAWGKKRYAYNNSMEL